MADRLAVVVGVNAGGTDVDGSPFPELRFAERDAADVAATLTDERSGTFDPDDVTLLLGPDATPEAVKRALRTAAGAVEPGGTLLFYFAGHGYRPPRRLGDTCLVLAGDEPTRIADESDDPLRVRFLQDDVFRSTDAACVLILDCCHAGAVVAAERRRRGDRGNWMHDFAPGAGMQAALLACAPDRHARERDDLGHGAFTDLLLRALRGSGGHPGVTLGDVVAELDKADIEPRPVLHLRTSRPSTVLTWPPHGEMPTFPPAGRGPGRSRAEASLVPLRHPLEDGVPTITAMLDAIATTDTDGSPDTDGSDELARLTMAARVVGGSGAAFVVPGERWAATASTVGFDASVLHDLDSDDVTRLVASGGGGWLGFVAPAGARRLLCVPLGSSKAPEQRLLVVTDPAPAVVDVGGPAGSMLAAIAGRAHRSVARAELAALTALRRGFGWVPGPLFERCFETFRSCLAGAHMVFQPIIELNRRPSSVGIHGWEALLRADGERAHAPHDLFEAARAFGPMFAIELDLVVLEKALRAYADAHGRSPYTAVAPRPVNINVSIRSLMNRTYEDRLRSLLAETGLEGKVTLEISEQDVIEPPPGEQWLPTPQEYFGERLALLSESTGIRFAIDDFGVGHSSLDRVAALHMAQIKIDRSVLGHDAAAEEIAFIVRLARSSPGREGRPVVVEGFEGRGAEQVSLRELWDAGVRLVQGNVAALEAGTDLDVLSDGVRHWVAEQITATSARISDGS